MQICLVANFLHHLFVAQPPFPVDDSRTYRAASLLLACTGIDSRFPNVAFLTNPPDLFVRTSSDHFGCQRAIEDGIPLGRNFGMGRGKVVKPYQHFLPGAVGTAGMFSCPGTDRSHIVVAERTAPPNSPFGEGGNLSWQKASVFVGVPLPGDFRKTGNQIVLPRQDNPS